ncbi:hypothetical protein [Arthrobacter cupressi]|uniref:Uncharacterized protein n=1 Tax=Arthrobacter cupressi TaxID=1045773 RepID=A0A1G8K5T0_9MICC|nr:hypothetical protein [Arthrobacter cupressi]NYD77326.1 hypothetical protein [Arthrobacter cupressi]SDI38762.1 hypothetical protein SAMN05216555_102141 [Arthrobacter cupressi]
MRTNTLSKPKRARIISVLAVSLGLAGAGLALGTPAQASTLYSCTVTPLKPIFSHFNTSGVKVLDYRITASCTSSRSLYIQQQRWEDDSWPNGDDYLGGTDFSRYLSAGTSTTIHNYRTLVDGELGYEEVYQKVRFKVGSGGVWSGYTGWQNSAVLSISN